jgi:tetratricopeptide (TPR) repeat protein
MYSNERPQIWYSGKKRVMPKQANSQMLISGVDRLPTYAPITDIVLPVLDENIVSFKVRQEGVTGWISRDDVVLSNEAVALFANAVQVDPLNADALGRLATAWLEQNNTRQSKECAVKLIDLAPNVASGYAKKAAAQTLDGDYSAAVVDYTTAICLDGTKVAHWNNRAIVHNLQRQFALAINDCTHAITLNPIIAAPWCTRGIALNGCLEHKKAIEDITEAIRLDSDAAVAWNARGISYAGAREYVNAISDFTEAIRRDDMLMAPRINRSQAYMDIGDDERAISDLTVALQFEPDRPDVNALLASFIGTSNRSDLDKRDAVIFARRACSLSGWARAEYMDILAMACAVVGELDEACRWQRKALLFHDYFQSHGNAALRRLADYQTRRAHKLRKGREQGI